MKSLIRFFSSVKLAIFLLIIITAASLVGTLIPQQRSTQEYAARYGEIASLLHSLQLTRLYQSLWFITLLFLFSLNIITCTLTRFSPKLRRLFRPPIEKESKKILALKIQDRFKKPWKLDRTKENIKKCLSSSHYRSREEKKENKIYFLARKRILGTFGSDVVHLGLLVILAGGIISGLGGSRKNITLTEGQILPVPGADFKVKLDKFETEYYPNGSIRDWKSTLTVIEERTPSLTKTIEVNHPLSYKGYVFYQSSYGWNWENPSLEIWIKKREEPSFLNRIELKVGEKTRLHAENIELTVLHFIPDFVINERNEIATRSLEPNNPAAFIQGTQGGKQIFSGWIFAKFPDFARIHSSTETDLSFELKDFKADQYSGIQISKDPGVNFIWLGCLILMIGLIIAFYWPTREIRVILEGNHEKTEVISGGIAAKSKEAFRSEFEKIMTSVRRSK